MRRFSIATKAIVTYFLIQCPLSGQAEQELSLDPSQAVEMALANNRSLAAARSVIQQAAARHDSAGRLDNPELTLSYASDWTFNNEGESTLGIGFEQRFPVAKRLSIIKRIAQKEIELAEIEVQNQERLLAREVELACNDIAYIEAQMELRHSMLEINQRFAKFVDSRIENAEASPIDANQIRIELYAIEQEIRRLEIDRSNRLGSLRPMLGLDTGTPITILSSFEAIADAGNFVPYGLENLNTHPKFQLKKRLLEIADSQTSLAMANRWEDIAVGVFLEDERSIDEPVGIGNDRFLGLSVSIPLPLRKRNRGEYQASLSFKEQVRQELAATELELLNAAETLRHEAEKLHEQASHYEANATQLVEKNLREMNEAYSSGLISLGDLFRSQEQGLKIQSAYLSMIHDYKQAEIKWRAATNRSL